MSIANKLKVAAWAIRHRKEVKKVIKKERKRLRDRAVRKRKLNEKAEIVRNSEFFDEEWYLRNNFDVRNRGLDAATHYVKYGAPSRNPSPYFCSEEYWALHADVMKARVNPLLHYEANGRAEGREIYFRERRPPVFPEGSVECTRAFRSNPPKHRRVAVLSCYFGDGTVPETLEYLIKGLNEVVDNIILVGDCKVMPDELGKLEDQVCYVHFERHEQYDFGSYKRGLAYARESGLIERADELVLMNDSCYGPVFPFDEAFDKMTEHYCDFWGYTASQTSPTRKYVQSSFVVLKKPVLDAGLIDEFLSRVEGTYDRGSIVATLETELTDFLTGNGMLLAIFAESPEFGVLLFDNPVTYLKYRVPLVKKKAFSNRSKEDLLEAFQIMADNAPELAQHVHFIDTRRQHDIITLKAHRASFPEKERRIRDKVDGGGKVEVVFLVGSASMFPAGPLFHLMLEDSMFEPSIGIVPDYRRRDAMAVEMERCRESLLELGYPENRIKMAERDRVGRWNDLCDGADIVCYCTPYAHITSFRYIPPYSVGRDFLPIMVNYGFYRSLYDRDVLALDTYSCLWKAFFECEETLEEYRRCSRIDGSNAEMTGYVKMDALATREKKPAARKRIFVALHHSIVGGYNALLSLSHFISYFDYFSELPDRYPEVDFIYRPHPFLLSALMKAEGWSEFQVKSFVKRMKHKDNVRWSDGADYLQDFADSDACIQDCGSFLVEYLYTGKPCCFMLKSPEDIGSKFAPLGKECLDQCYLSYDTGSIDAFISDVVLRGDDPKAVGRDKLARRIMVNYPHAAEEAMRRIKDSIASGK